MSNIIGPPGFPFGISAPPRAKEIKIDFPPITMQPEVESTIRITAQEVTKVLRFIVDPATAEHFTITSIRIGPDEQLHGEGNGIPGTCFPPLPEPPKTWSVGEVAQFKADCAKLFDSNYATAYTGQYIAVKVRNRSHRAQTCTLSADAVVARHG